MNDRQIIGRSKDLFASDLAHHARDIADAIGGARVLVYGGAGSIGKEVVYQLFKYNPAVLHVMDVSENNLVELVRHLRSTLGYTSGETQFLPLDMGSIEAQAFLESEPAYDYVLNIAAMKHVRSEKDAYSLMRLIKTNVVDTLTAFERARYGGTKKFFAVSTDKAKNPASLMGASKRIMELALFERSDNVTPVSTARFANVAFSDGSLLHGFRQRLLQNQPIAAPRDVKRYFITGPESGLLCVASLVLGSSLEIFFPKTEDELRLLSLSEIAVRFLDANGFAPVEVESEEEARGRAAELIGKRQWPCYFFDSDTSGEKPFEEFFSSEDVVDWQRFSDIAIIASPFVSTEEKARTAHFLAHVAALRERGNWTLDELTDAISAACPELSHVKTDRSLDDKM